MCWNLFHVLRFVLRREKPFYSNHMDRHHLLIKRKWAVSVNEMLCIGAFNEFHQNLWLLMERFSQKYQMDLSELSKHVVFSCINSLPTKQAMCYAVLFPYTLWKVYANHLFQIILFVQVIKVNLLFHAEYLSYLKVFPISLQYWSSKFPCV